MSKHTWNESMGEISGFGGGYEAVCRAMVLAGIEWLDQHPDADPQFHGYKNVYGLVVTKRMGIPAYAFDRWMA